MKSLSSRIFPLRFAVLFKAVIVLLLFLIAAFYIRPLRNLILRPVWPRIWRHLSSMDVYMMTHTPEINVTDLKECPYTVSYNSTSLQDVHLTSTFPSSTAIQVKEESHRHFLPIIDDASKRETVHLYLVLAEALNNGGIQHLFVDGSLLGVVRHNGFVPWDDDIDISISVMEWKRVRVVLSCIKGFRLTTNPKMHWKFQFADRPFPFIDVFFYTENESYIWANPHYITQTMVYPKPDVFPLKALKFENVDVPVPRNAEKLANMVFDMNTCQSPSVNHKTSVSLTVVTVPCSDLEYLYVMKNVNYVE